MIVYILLLHFIGDFVFQPHKIASTKSYKIESLFTHIFIYWSTLSLGLFFITDWWLEYATVNAMWHLTTDFVTSKLTAYLWAKEDWHNFFIVIGADQFAHYFVLINTMFLL